MTVQQPPPPLANLETIEAALQRRREQEAEYGKYVANQSIDIFGVRAFNKGDPVPVGHVQKFGWAEGPQEEWSVDEVGSEAAEEVAAEVAGPTRPKDSGPRTAWEAYALSQGIPAEDLEGQSRDEIAARFPTQES